MSTVRVHWLDATYHILFFELDPNFKIGDYLHSVDSAWDMLDKRDIDEFYVAADVSELGQLPINMITAMVRAYSKKHPAFAGYTIFIGAPTHIQYLVGRFQSLIRSHAFAFADDISEVPAMIARFQQMAQPVE